jgi:hypothetical protein
MIKTGSMKTIGPDPNYLLYIREQLALYDLLPRALREELQQMPVDLLNVVEVVWETYQRLGEANTLANLRNYRKAIETGKVKI